MEEAMTQEGRRGEKEGPFRIVMERLASGIVSYVLYCEGRRLSSVESPLIARFANDSISDISRKADLCGRIVEAARNYRAVDGSGKTYDILDSIMARGLELDLLCSEFDREATDGR
jgi:hypothetical protein